MMMEKKWEARITNGRDGKVVEEEEGGKEEGGKGEGGKEEGGKEDGESGKKERDGMREKE